MKPMIASRPSACAADLFADQWGIGADRGYMMMRIESDRFIRYLFCFSWAQ